MKNVFGKISKQRWLALALLGFVILALIFLLIVPLISKSIELDNEKEELLFRLHRYQRIIANKDNVIENIKSIKSDFQKQGHFSSQGTVALASADLQQVIKNAISTAGGDLTSTQVLPSKNEGDYTLIAVKVRMSGDMEALRSVLYHIETAKPLLIINDMDIRPVRGKRNRLTRKIEPSNKLNVSFQVSSFMGKQAS